MEKIDAIVLAGDREGYRSVGRRNKCLLEIEGKPLLHVVLEALCQSLHVAEIYVVGPEELLGRSLGSVSWGKPVTVVAQGANVVENFHLAFQEKLSRRGEDPYVLICAGDMPFLTCREVDRFVEGSGYREYDCVVGFSSRQSLLPFRSYGIRLGCVYFRQFAGRIANLLIGNPLEAKNFDYVRRLYRLRYQKKLVNYLRLLLEVIRSDLRKGEIVRLSLLAQLGLQLDRLGLSGIARIVGKMSDVGRFERCAGDILGARISAFCMDPSFGALDVDSARELEIYRRHLQEFRSHVTSLLAAATLVDPGGKAVSP